MTRLKKARAALLHAQSRLYHWRGMCVDYPYDRRMQYFRDLSERPVLACLNSVWAEQELDRIKTGKIR